MNDRAMQDLDLGLLRTFVSVIEAGGFTRAGERVHRTQSTVSQQIRRLEDQLGRVLLDRNSKAVVLTEDGERLLGYARRILSLSREAQAALGGREITDVVRLGVTEDYAIERLPHLLSEFARRNRTIRLDVRCDLSVRLGAALKAGDLDVALMKQEPGQKGAVATRSQPLYWLVSEKHAVEREDPVPLVVFPQGCLYRSRAIHELESRGRAWRIAYSSPNLSGIQAAVTAGLGVTVLAGNTMPEGARILGVEDGFPALPDTELGLYVAAGATGDGVRMVAELLLETLPEDMRTAA